MTTKQACEKFLRDNPKLTTPGGTRPSVRSLENALNVADRYDRGAPNLTVAKMRKQLGGSSELVEFYFGCARGIREYL